MDRFFSKSFILIFILVLIPFINFANYPFLNGETGLIEISQLILLGLGLILNIRFYKLQKKFVKKWILYLKNFIIAIIFYEEISFLTANFFPFLKQYNDNAEFNIHNATFLWKTFNQFSIIGTENVDMYLYTIIFTLILFVIGFGSYFRFLSRFNYLFFEKKNSLFCLLYILNLFLSYLLRYFNISTINNLLYPQELVELFIYLVLLLDIKDKINNFKKINQKL
jgi:hypothetical protein